MIESEEVPVCGEKSDLTEIREGQVGEDVYLNLLRYPLHAGEENVG